LKRIPTGFLFLLPCLLAIAIFQVYPLFYSFWVTLHSDIIGRGTKFVGFQNYVSLVQDPNVWHSLSLTLYYDVLVIVMSILGGLGVALVLNEPFFGRRLVRSLIIVPWAMSEIACGLVWGWILNPTYGWLNGLLYSLGVISEYVSWFGNGLQALTTVSIAGTWSVMPIPALLFLSGLQSISEELYDSAKIDGANAFQSFWHITRPLLTPTLLVALVISSMYASWTFGLIWTLTGGGPGSYTTTLSWLGYSVAFRYSKPGYGTTIYYLGSAVMLILTFIYIRVLMRGRTVFL